MAPKIKLIDAEMQAAIAEKRSLAEELENQFRNHKDKVNSYYSFWLGLTHDQFVSRYNNERDPNFQAIVLCLRDQAEDMERVLLEKQENDRRLQNSLDSRIGDSLFPVGTRLDPSGELPNNPGFNAQGSNSLFSFETTHSFGDRITASTGAHLGRAQFNINVGPTSATANASASLLTGEATLNIGDTLTVSTGAHVGRVHGSANLGFNVGRYVGSYDGRTGEWSERFVYLGIGGNASVGGSLLSGNISLRSGNDIHSSEVNASGSVLGANANAGLRIEMTDQGQTAIAEAGAKAYVASGRVEANRSFLGLRVGVNLSGYAGGVGAKAHAGIRNNELDFKVSGAAGLGLGLGVTIGFDPSEFQEGIRAIGDAASNAWEFFTGLFD